MFEFLAGPVEALRPGLAVLSTGGVGWQVQVSSNTARHLKEGQPARLFVHLVVSEAALTLYGFAEELERSLFRRLIQVSGIGPASALGVLSAFEARDLVEAILDGDTARMTAVKGIGKKTADRLVVELRDRLTDLSAGGGGGKPTATAADELSRVLLDLGFRPADARAAAEAARESLGADAALEDLLKVALRRH